MKKGDIILNKWAGKINPCRISIITYIGKTFTNVLYLHSGNLKKGQLYTQDMKNDKEHFVVIGHLDYEKVIRDKLSELKGVITMPNELKPCPFCGGEAKLYNQRVINGYDYSYVQCKKCHIQTTCYDVSTDYCSSQKAIEAWNRRADNGNS